jgi:flagellar biosynthesis component FlhA
MGAVALLVVPLHPALLDVLLVANLATSLVLLLLALRVEGPLALTAFPTWIVLSTLLRLALNVSSTRLILLHGSAGKVISAFGTLVAGSSVVVGAVIFAVLSIVQLIVIAKGAERVAEVGARFHLDGLPGRQMAIDAELAQGAIDARKAQQKRSDLALESQFYGAMDGAMKFVKGDVIASFVIIFVNLCGGFALGMTERHMDALTSLSHYGLLTIGDGLATQIPSLVSATCAGILVTRVSSDQRGAGAQLATQFLGHPEALTLVALACALLGFLPGMPLAPFLTIAVGLIAARAVVRSSRREGGDIAGPGALRTARYALHVSPDLRHLLPGPLALRDSGLDHIATALEREALAPLGLPASITSRKPALEVVTWLPASTIELCVRDASVARTDLSSELRGAKLSEALDSVAHKFARALSHQAAELVGLDDVERWLDETAERAPAAVRAVVPSQLSVAELSEVLRALLAEGVAVRELDLVLEALADERRRSPELRDPGHLADVARRALRSALSRSVADDAGVIRIVQLDSMIEDTVREAVHLSHGRTKLRLAPGAARDIVAAVKRALEHAENGEARGKAPVVLTSQGTRRFVRELLAVDLPEVRVVCAEELLPQLSVERVGTATLFDLGEAARLAV